MNKENNFASAVIYCYNDKNLIPFFIDGLCKKMEETFLKYEIIIVNDCSIDDSKELIKNYASLQNDQVITILNMSYHQGIEVAMNAGVNLSIGDFVFEFDSMFVDYEWNLLNKIYFHSLKGYDIVSVKIDKKPRFLSEIFYKLFNNYANLQHNIGIETFRILSRRAINRIHSITKTIPFRKAAYANCGLPLDTVIYHPLSPVHWEKYKGRKSLAIDTLILFTNIAYKITITLTGIMMTITVGVSLYALIYKLMKNPVEGWTTTILFLSFGFFGLFLILAMVIKYLQIIVKLNFRKKQFLFESIEKL